MLTALIRQCLAALSQRRFNASILTGGQGGLVWANNHCSIFEVMVTSLSRSTSPPTRMVLVEPYR